MKNNKEPLGNLKNLFYSSSIWDDSEEEEKEENRHLLLYQNSQKHAPRNVYAKIIKMKVGYFSWYCAYNLGYDNLFNWKSHAKYYARVFTARNARPGFRSHHRWIQAKKWLKPYISLAKLHLELLWEPKIRLNTAFIPSRAKFEGGGAGGSPAPPLLLNFEQNDLYLPQISDFCPPTFGLTQSCPPTFRQLRNPLKCIQEVLTSRRFF